MLNSEEINDLRKLNEDDIKASTKLLIDGQNLLNKHQPLMIEREDKTLTTQNKKDLNDSIE